MSNREWLTNEQLTELARGAAAYENRPENRDDPFAFRVAGRSTRARTHTVMIDVPGANAPVRTMNAAAWKSFVMPAMAGFLMVGSVGVLATDQHPPAELPADRR
jgi:hypothetical protein